MGCAVLMNVDPGDKEFRVRIPHGSGLQLHQSPTLGLSIFVGDGGYAGAISLTPTQAHKMANWIKANVKQPRRAR
jgi:hypothetical protein